ncbi:recombinase family protein [Alicyclobacillus sp. ALC3]|uniref:recombinase family protein n=1 Tax=Alicyclobacillus sp. ALC3 TaxID=2796143 RepID=UPI002378E451|nr:recombinase family protein [Alicyclobacillus sp. ALC3]WDL96367.1 recombinase family protein [Alicyclobacillus sp. ALC3]
MRAALYSRVSTTMQADDGFSLDAQFDRLRSFCDSQGWTIVGIYTDGGVSAKNTDRPELQRLMKDIEAGDIDVVLVYKLDRLTRNVMDLYQLLQHFERYRVGFKSATEVFDTTSAMGRLFITIVAAMAQWEREQLAERTRMGQLEMTRQGRWSGGKPAFGYDYTDGTLLPREDQAQVVREIFRRYVAGDGLKQILNWLNKPADMQPSPGTRWTQTALKYVLRNPLYAGYVRYGYRTGGGRRTDDAVVVDGVHEGIVDRKTFERAQDIREGRARMPSRSGTGTYSLTGVLRCGLCGSAMHGVSHYRTRKSDGKVYRQYMCVEKVHTKLCSMPRMMESRLEEAILSKLEAYHYDLLEGRATDVVADADDGQSNNIDAALNKLQERRARWMDAYDKEIIDSEQLRNRLQQLTEEEMDLRVQLQALPTPQRRSPEMIADILRSFRAMWDTAEPSERKELIRAVVERIDVHPNYEVTIHYAG